MGPWYLGSEPGMSGRRSQLLTKKDEGTAARVARERLAPGPLALLACAVSSIALLGVGCEGGNPEMTRAQFVRQADAICRQAGAEQAVIAVKYKDRVRPGEYEAVTAVFVPPMTRELRRLSALSPPPGGQRRVEAILEQIEAGVNDAKADYLDLFVKETDPFAQANGAARQFGLSACAESSHAVIKPGR